MNTGYRDEAHCIKGFNLCVIDVDDGVDIDTVKLLLDEYKYLMHTTKRHTPSHNRFRIIFPLSHVLTLTGTDYKEFMNNIYEWLPFDVDTQTNQRSRKWLTHAGHHWYNEGELLDALQFIPKTKKNKERRQKLNANGSLTNIERWFLDKTGTGNRSNQLIKYSLMLLDSGRSYEQIQEGVMDFNSKLDNPLLEEEIMATIMRTIGKKINEFSE